jgi:hypothetical protein
MVLAGLLSPVATSTPARASGSEFETYQWNLSGWEGYPKDTKATNPGLGKRAVVYEAMTKIDYHGPFVVSFNEICSNQYNYIKDTLAARGYSSLGFSGRTDLTTGGNCDWFGNAVFVLGSGIGGYTYQFPTNSEFEKRGQACRNVSLFGGTYVGCSTHIDNEHGEYSEDQAAEAYHKIQDYYGGHKRIQGGDFNLPYSAMDTCCGWYGAYDEGDYPDNEATIGSSKYDYLFGNKGHLHTHGGNAVTPDNWSGHWHLYATFAND